MLFADDGLRARESKQNKLFWGKQTHHSLHGACESGAISLPSTFRKAGQWQTCTREKFRLRGAAATSLTIGWSWDSALPECRHQGKTPQCKRNRKYENKPFVWQRINQLKTSHLWIQWQLFIHLHVRNLHLPWVASLWKADHDGKINQINKLKSVNKTSVMMKDSLTNRATELRLYDIVTIPTWKNVLSQMGPQFPHPEAKPVS